MSFLTSLLINGIVFSLAFVYLAHGPSAAAPPPGQIQIEIIEAVPMIPPEPIVEITEVPVPADFFDSPPSERGADGEDAAGMANIDSPQFQWIFDSNFLQPPNRGKTFWVFVEFEIDTAGELASNPRIVTSSGEEDIDLETVRRLMKLKFTPALDKETGDPIRSTVPAWIVWYPGGKKLP